VPRRRHSADGVQLSVSKSTSQRREAATVMRHPSPLSRLILALARGGRCGSIHECEVRVRARGCTRRVRTWNRASLLAGYCPYVAPICVDVGLMQTAKDSHVIMRGTSRTPSSRTLSFVTCLATASADELRRVIQFAHMRLRSLVRPPLWKGRIPRIAATFPCREDPAYGNTL
jgi:hypothetical protein